MSYINIFYEYLDLKLVVLILLICVLATLVISIIALRRKTAPYTKPFVTTPDTQNIIHSLQEQIDSLQKNIVDIGDNLPRTAIVRFNPFRENGVGGNQSFSLASINMLGNGFIITHLFSREMSRVSTKHITAWDCDLELSPEEKQALEQVKSNS